jgi:hypothetical protein
MNFYEDESLEQKFEELTDLMGQLVLDMLLVSLRKAVKENQVFKEWAEAKLPVQQEKDSF